jgi:ATP-dependent DNA helicase RecG
MLELNPKTLEEDQGTEFKESFNERALKSLCAFVNTDGGSVFVPVDDNGVVLEDPLTDQQIQNVANRVVDNLGIQPSIISHRWQGRSFIEIKVPNAESPIPLKGKYYIRIGNTTQRMNSSQLRDRMLESVPWDSQLVKGVGLDALDTSEIKRFVKSGQDAGRISAEIDPNKPEAILSQTNLLKEEGLTKAGILLFGKDPQSYFPAAVIRIGEFASESEVRNDKTAKGHLFQQVRKAEDIIKDRMQHGYEISDQQFTRQERWTYPLPAIREGIMNAVIHRDYHKQGAQIQIKLFNDHLSIFSPGGLPDQLDVDDLLTNHPSIRRNNLLANVFFRAGLIESFGTGISRIRSSLKDAGLPEPVLEDRGHSFVLSFYRYSKEKSVEELDVSNFNERQLKALELAKEGSIRTQDLATIFTDVEKRTLRRDLKELVEKDFLEAKGKTSDRYYQLKK